MKLLLLGDIVGKRTVDYLQKNLWQLRKENKIDMVIANGENATEIMGLSPDDADTLFASGIDVITGGNHIFHNRAIYTMLDDCKYLLRPLNLSPKAYGNGECIFECNGCNVLVVNLIGMMGMEYSKNPFDAADEVLRRNKKYGESAEVCEYLKSICAVSDNPHAERYIYKARHNVAKSNLYRAFDLASAEDGRIIPETLEIYKAAANELYELCGLGYAESRSQYAMLISYPDAVSKRYIDAIFEDKSIKTRREEAFFINIETARREYKKDFDNTSFYYPLQQCASALLHNEISCYAEPSELELMTFEELMYVSDVKFGEYAQDCEKASLAAVRIMLDKLREKKSSRILDCLYAKLLLLEGSDKHGLINTLLLSSDTEPLSVFMYSATNKAEPSELDALRHALIKKAALRAMDAFDAVYILKDVEFMWQALKGRHRYSDEYIRAVTQILDMEGQL